MAKPEPLPCPICEQEMESKPYATAEGFRYVCKGSEGEPHRVTVYVQFYQKRGPGRPRTELVAAGSRAEGLLERATRLGGKG